MAFFGPDRKEIWEQLSREINANLIEGGSWKGDRIEVTYSNWTLYLDTDTVPTGDTGISYTRMRAPFVSKDGLVFKIYRSSVFTGIGKILGMQDIETGHEGFDDDYVIKGSDAKQIRRLFDSDLIRDLIIRQPDLCLEIRSTEGTHDEDNDRELYFNVSGSITDPIKLKELFDLFMALLDELVRIGSAYSKAPDVEIYKDSE